MYNKLVGMPLLCSDLLGLVSLCLDRKEEEVHMPAPERQKRLGVRQNTGPFPPTACVRRTAGTLLLWLVCRNRIHYLDAGEAAGINAQAAVTISMPPPSLSVLSYNLLACGRYTQMLMLFPPPPQIGPKLPNEGEGAYYSTSCIKRESVGMGLP